MANRKIVKLYAGCTKKRFIYSRKWWLSPIIDEYFYDENGNLIDSIEESKLGDVLEIQKEFIYNDTYFELKKKGENNGN